MTWENPPPILSVEVYELLLRPYFVAHGTAILSQWGFATSAFSLRAIDLSQTDR